MVFHELAESYERTHNGIQYKNTTTGTTVTKGAHDLAKDRELLWSKKSNTPGEIASPVNVSRPSRRRQAQIQAIITNYITDFYK
jgi:hypothetical protein